MTCRTWYLVRHGETEWNATSRMQGQLDSRLTALGREHAKGSARLLARLGVDSVIASPLGRVRETIAIMMAEVSLTAVFDDRLKEWSAGDWSGELYAEIGDKWPAEWAEWKADRYNARSPGGENFVDLADRARNFLADVPAGPDERIAIVAHGFINRALAGTLLSLSPDSVSACVLVCADALAKGRVILYPTESSYALGADATNEEAVKRVFDLKARDGTKAMPVIVDSIDTMANYGQVEGLAHFLSDKLMPGQLNLIVPQRPHVPGHPTLASNVGKDGTIAFRIPRHDFDLRLCKAFGKPITATSANVSGHPAIYSSVEAIARFSKDVAVIIDAGDLPIRNFSTIFDLTANPFSITRQGMVSAKTLYAAVRQFYELQPPKEPSAPKTSASKKK